MHALIVDDSTTIRMILKVHLNKLGFEVTEAGNGREALVCVKKMAKTDLVLVDWNMPEMDGVSFVREGCEGPSAEPERDAAVDVSAR